MTNIAIVVIAYNRVESVKRLLTSLQNACYHQQVDLIVSIDKSGTDVVENFSEKIEWLHGKKIVKTFPERLGLRNHVLTCGNYLNEYNYDAIIVLEDDICVAQDFFNFSIQAVEKYEQNQDIAGISLYSNARNLNADRPFKAVYKGYDVFFMQYAQSWGQVWMKDQWNAFYDWYKNSAYEQLDANKVPDNILAWPQSSWLKYHIEYCIDQNKFFVYPYESLSTNFADAGTHYKFNTNKMQVPLSMAINKTYILANKIDDSSYYDVSFENLELASVLKMDANELGVDLYGKKKTYSNTKYLLSTQAKKYKIIKSFGLQMRPWELNICHGVPGNDIFLYDLTCKEKQEKINHRSLIHWVYDTHGEVILKRNFVDVMCNEVWNKLRKK